MGAGQGEALVQCWMGGPDPQVLLPSSENDHQCRYQPHLYRILKVYWCQVISFIAEQLAYVKISINIPTKYRRYNVLVGGGRSHRIDV